MVIRPAIRFRCRNYISTRPVKDTTAISPAEMSRNRLQAGRVSWTFFDLAHHRRQARLAAMALFRVAALTMRSNYGTQITKMR